MTPQKPDDLLYRIQVEMVREYVFEGKPLLGEKPPKKRGK